MAQSAAPTTHHRVQLAPILNGLLGIGILTILLIVGRDVIWNPTDPIEALTYLLHRTATVLAAWVTLSALIVAWATTAYIGSTMARSLARFAVPWLRRLAVSGVAGALIVTGTFGSSLPSLATNDPAQGVEIIDLPDPLRDLLEREQSTDDLAPPEQVRRDTDAQTRHKPDSTTAKRTGARATQVQVSPGDNLWDISDRQVMAVRDSKPSQSEIADYWLRVIEANRGSLISGDPDLIYPGEKVTLPPLDSKPSQG